MILGTITDQGEPVIHILVKGLRTAVRMPAVVDTGFNGDLCLPTSIAVQLGLELCAVDDYELADGTVRRTQVFLGCARWFDEDTGVSIVLTDSPQALVGTNLLKGKRLEMDFSKREIRIVP